MKKIILFLLLHISVVVNAQNENYQVYMGGDAKATLTGNDVFFKAQIPNGTKFCSSGYAQKLAAASADLPVIG